MIDAEAWSVPYGVERIGKPKRAFFDGRAIVAAARRDIRRGHLTAARARLSRLPEDHLYADAFGHTALGDALFDDRATRVRACLDYDWAMAQILVYNTQYARAYDDGLASYLSFMLSWCDVTLPPTEDRGQYRHSVRDAHILSFAASIRSSLRFLGDSDKDADLAGLYQSSLDRVVDLIPDPELRTCIRERPARITDPACARLYAPTVDPVVLCGE